MPAALQARDASSINRRPIAIGPPWRFGRARPTAVRFTKRGCAVAPGPSTHAGHARACHGYPRSSGAGAGSVDGRNKSTCPVRILVNLAVVVKHRYPMAGLDPWAVSPRALFRGHPRLFLQDPSIARRGRPGRARPRGSMCFKAFEDHRKSEPDSRGTGPAMTISGCAGDTPEPDARIKSAQGGFTLLAGPFAKKLTADGLARRCFRGRRS